MATRGAAERGMTIIEVLASLAVFSAGVVSIIAMQIAGINGNAVANSISIASNLATTVLERKQVEEFALLTGTMVETFDIAGAENPVATKVFYTATTTVTDQPGGWAKDLQVDISWKSSPTSPNPRSLTLYGRVRNPASR